MSRPIIMDGKALSLSLAEKFKVEVSRLTNMGIRPSLSIVMVGEDPASKIFVRNKMNLCASIGVDAKVLAKPSIIGERELLEIIKALNDDENVHGILVQLPLPSHINPFKILATIEPSKDVDGLTPLNLGRLTHGDETLAPCGAKAVMRILEAYKVNLEGLNMCIVSNSILVGKPLTIMATNRFATVTMCHIKTKNLKEHTSTADVLVSATGVAHIIKFDMVKEGAVAVDVGIAKLCGKTVGDIDFENVKNRVSMITPVPGGVGPVTVAMVIDNLLNAVKLQRCLV
ncbi:bifunctional 5,10-methylenetetrahydrofolate dehydrogenase/5,10-methenyltetrahydrofolate cyclohydrolase [Candidatus Bathyarchaeota archaeon]|nr:bifunctional 5,10-methylenetetrahydrofolate dehydrogenase/5,10-methenyltetrahydrofolate cyclohydrolase [Candidatus Bathyarchaeota archaeon]MBS7612722.1 bifunctional 5,10-methylenetetrahydrofolate dehydrogenase/5,10-methenyltetrahydrofolate cyclohydrolase [Candidatus Bathyarchaeota archaeon]